MRILVFTTYYYIEGRPELIRDTNAIHYLLKYLSAENEILVINTYVNTRKHILRYLRPRDLKQYFSDYSFEKDNIKVHIIETQVITGRYFHEMEWGRLARRSKEILQAEQFTPDVIISHFPSYSFGFIDRLDTDCKRIAVLHSTDLYHAQHRKAFVKGLREKYDAVYCRSEKIRDQMKAYNLPGLKEEIVYSGTILPSQFKSKTFEDSDHPVIVYSGKLIRRKNVDWIIECLCDEALKDTYLYIVGTGPEEKRLRRMVRRLGLQRQVRFFGQVSRKQVQQIMERGDIFCMVSVQETFGLVYLEAMACGCLTIGTEKEGIDGVIRNAENGFLVSSRESLRACLKNILAASPAEKLRISENARETAIEFSEENMSSRYYRLIEEVLKE